jgi:hypothetical protein
MSAVLHSDIQSLIKDYEKRCQQIRNDVGAQQQLVIDMTRGDATVEELRIESIKIIKLQQKLDEMIACMEHMKKTPSGELLYGFSDSPCASKNKKSGHIEDKNLRNGRNINT